jgi:hypothetical protein
VKCTEHIWLCCQSKNTIPQCVSSTRDTFLQFLISINFLQYIISYYVQTKKEDTQMAKKESPPRKILRCFPETTYTQNYSAATKWKSGQLTIYSTQRYLYILWILIHICEKSLTKWRVCHSCLLFVRLRSNVGLEAGYFNSAFLWFSSGLPRIFRHNVSKYAPTISFTYFLITISHIILKFE